jgi:M6 family metalloprotease-like protein
MTVDHPNPLWSKTGQKQFSKDFIQGLFSTLINSSTYDIKSIINTDSARILFVFAGQERSYKNGSGLTSIAAFTCCTEKVAFSDRIGSRAWIPNFSIIGEMQGDHSATRGIYAHELGHLLLGLPDLYNGSDQRVGISDQGLMGTGSWNYAPGRHIGDDPADMIGFSKALAGFAKVQSVQRSNQWIELNDTTKSADYKQVWLDPYRHKEAIQLEYRRDAGFKRKGLVATYLTSDHDAYKDFWIHSLSHNSKRPLFGSNPNMTLPQGNKLISSIYTSKGEEILKVKLEGNSEDKGSFGYNTQPYQKPNYFSRRGETVIMELNNTAGKANFADGVDLYLSGNQQDSVQINLAAEQSSNIIATMTVSYTKPGWYRVMFDDNIAIDSYNSLFIEINSSRTQVAYEKLTHRHQLAPIFFTKKGNVQKRIHKNVYSMRLLVSGNVEQDASFGTTAPIIHQSRSSAGTWSLASLWLLLLAVGTRLNRRV